MKLVVTRGAGSGLTRLAAFHKALKEAGIANFNLIYLSSVIPVGSNIECGNPDLDDYSFGSKLYVVMSERTEIIPGKEAWAGIGWVQAKDGSGLFIEHSGERESEVMHLIEESMKDIRGHSERKVEESNFITMGIRCDDQPVCSVVAVVYQGENWKT